MAIIVFSVAFVIGLSSAARNGRVGFLQNMTGVLESPVKKVLSSTVNWFNTIYTTLFLPRMNRFVPSWPMHRNLPVKELLPPRKMPACESCWSCVMPIMTM